MSRAFSLAALVVGGLIIADFLSHGSVTDSILRFFGKESGYLAGGGVSGGRRRK